LKAGQGRTSTSPQQRTGLKFQTTTFVVLVHPRAQALKCRMENKIKRAGNLYSHNFGAKKKLQITIKSYIDISATITVGDVR
jgi:hypothetical protein